MEFNLIFLEMKHAVEQMTSLFHIHFMNIKQKCGQQNVLGRIYTACFPSNIAFHFTKLIF
jgi:hypothetical protein